VAPAAGQTREVHVINFLITFHERIICKTGYRYLALRDCPARFLRGVENRLKRSFLINCKTASLYYLILKGHHHKRSKKIVSAS
jgi:hypothetical protein